MAFLWSATEDTSTYNYSLIRHLFYYNGIVNRNNPSNSEGASVRCLKDTFSIGSIPSLTTTAIAAITSASATSGGNITAEGGATITTRGVVWSTTTNPTISLSTKITDGTGIGSFTSTLTNLAPKTTYYVRAYAKNSAGTGYGNEISFTTSDSTVVMGIPCPGTPTVKDIDGNTYTSFDGIRQTGFLWSSDRDRIVNYGDENGELAWYKYFSNHCDINSGIDVNYKSVGASVICIKD
jgi:hypothetical protein